MNHSEPRPGEARRQHSEAILARQLFQWLPMRSGYWLHPDLKVAWVIFAWNGPGRAKQAGHDRKTLRATIGSRYVMRIFGCTTALIRSASHSSAARAVP